MVRSAADPSERLLDACLDCVARVGWSKTTLDDVAQAAGCARATVYRRFPGKQPLLAALVRRELDRFGSVVCDAGAGAATLADALVAMITAGAAHLLAHDALRTVLTVEPGRVVPHIAFDRGDAFLAGAADRCAPALLPFAEPEHALRIAEWVARLGISYLSSPEATALVDPDQVRRLVDDFVLPGLQRPAPTAPQEVFQ